MSQDGPNIVEVPQQVSRRYGSPVDGLARLLTAGLLTTWVGAILLFGFMPTFYQAVTGLFLGFSALVLSGAYSFRPIGYGLAPSGLTIYFAWRRIRIPWDTVSSVELHPAIQPFRAVRVFGSSGIFGYLGRYWSPALGFHVRLVTDRRRVVLVRRKTSYCLSPDDPDRFVREAGSYLESESAPTHRPVRGGTTAGS
ncbi:MAG: hypothetical protein KC729_03900 [Candidatus Eisenbacteria bacterium]|uniref:Bacterial Pleckstrin homology domain-containing protein n=1 Tax=Eiseniibacteriota bacterium TaxID=2212470 RepID=A0A956LY77_UNCEI|nr:hypothetical protein [Candidatus Eisenbacteria bacterium]